MAYVYDTVSTSEYEKLKADLGQAVAALEISAGRFESLAKVLDSWAVESRQGGWSTHQVRANQDTATECRLCAGAARAVIAKLKGKP